MNHALADRLFWIQIFLVGAVTDEKSKSIAIESCAEAIAIAESLPDTLNNEAHSAHAKVRRRALADQVLEGNLSVTAAREKLGLSPLVTSTESAS